MDSVRVVEEVSKKKYQKAYRCIMERIIIRQDRLCVLKADETNVQLLTITQASTCDISHTVVVLSELVGETLMRNPKRTLVGVNFCSTYVLIVS